MKDTKAVLAYEQVKDDSALIEHIEVLKSKGFVWVYSQSNSLFAMMPKEKVSPVIEGVGSLLSYSEPMKNADMVFVKGIILAG